MQIVLCSSLSSPPNGNITCIKMFAQTIGVAKHVSCSFFKIVHRENIGRNFNPDRNFNTCIKPHSPSFLLLRSQFPSPKNSDQSQRETQSLIIREMVTLIVATTIDPASIGPASALLAMPGWHPGPFVQGIPSYVNKQVRLLKHDNSIISEDHLDKRWEETTGEIINDVIFLSKHTAVSNRPALTIHPIGVPHLREDELTPQGGKPGWAAPPNPRIAPWMRLLKKIAESHNLTPEFEITMEATHHGPWINSPTMFIEIGSTEEYWKRQDAAQAIALLVWEGLGLGGGDDIGNWNRNNDKKKVLLGIGGGHYVPRHMDIVMKDGLWVGHLLSGYSLPMEDPSQSKGAGTNDIGGTWKQSIKASFEATRSAFPDGEIMAHLDQKSFKSWQKNAIISFLQEQNIKIGKPADFF